MPEPAESLSTQLLEFLQQRVPLWKAFALLVLLVALLRLVPSVAWWGLLYTELRLDLWWPAAVLFSCFLVREFGNRHFRRRGLPQFFPYLASILVLAVIAFICYMLIFSASHWNLPVAALNTALLFCAAFFLAQSWVAYGKLWRSREEDIRNTIRKAVEKQKIDTDLTRAKSSDLYGTRHCLILLHTEFYRRLSARQFLPKVTAGKACLEYLKFQWAPSELSTQECEWLRLDIARELLTVLTLEDWKLRQDHKQDFNAWNRLLTDSPLAYSHFLSRCFDIGMKQHTSTDEAANTLTGLVDLYCWAVNTFQSPPKAAIDAAPILRDTWLVAARNSLPHQAVFDLWMEFCTATGTPAVLVGTPARGLVHSAARDFLRDHYRTWQNRLPVAWRAGLAARADWIAGD